MPTPRLRAGFVRLSPDRIPPSRYREATSLSHYRDLGEEVPLKAVEPVDLIVAGRSRYPRTAPGRASAGPYATGAAFTIATPELVPIRLAPAATIRQAVS
ncbi:hypothetical protein caldi_08030 [Caldinitratiruptor microaerophilus]|uniref:Uncharacterized protein n=1 Tax=Caldinitratiruptor microaerophilus TaxID=671077 RepID=A0AA35CJV8_9FIRM|nr:hypothetical protein caldi_08030 [Caldinitratiruptor microaerophilus]